MFAVWNVITDRADRERLGIVFGRDREDSGRLHLNAVDVVLRHGLEHIRIGRIEEIG